MRRLAEPGPGPRVSIHGYGTAVGISLLCLGGVHVAAASRPMSREEEAACEDAGVETVQLPVARDALTFVAHPDSPLRCLTLQELQRLWEPNSRITSWRQLRRDMPDKKIRLYGPGSGSGTFAFFSRTVVGRARSSRADVHRAQDHRTVIRGVGANLWGLGYVGGAYASRYEELVRSLAVDFGRGCVLPKPAEIESGRYGPLTRELRLYVSRASLGRDDMRVLLDFYLDAAPRIAPALGYGALPPLAYERAREKLGPPG